MKFEILSLLTSFYFITSFTIVGKLIETNTGLFILLLTLFIIVKIITYQYEKGNTMNIQDIRNLDTYTKQQILDELFDDSLFLDEIIEKVLFHPNFMEKLLEEDEFKFFVNDNANVLLDFDYLKDEGLLE